MSKIIKPDGLRGIAIAELNCELVMHLGRALAQCFSRGGMLTPVIMICKDPRRSADALEAALCAGICSGGGIARCLGVLPSSGMALLMTREAVSAGVAITAESASYEYNGLRLFNGAGLPMNAEECDAVEALLPSNMPLPVASHRACGVIQRDTEAACAYRDLLIEKNPLPQMPYRVALDCANGAVSEIAAPLFEHYGMEVHLLHHSPDGLSINHDCGVQSMDTLMEFVAEHQCDAGFSFDGDGGRCLAVDAGGELLDGDCMLAILASDAMEQGMLSNHGIAATVMSNLGLLRFAEQKGILVHTTRTGARFVPEKMRNAGLSLGGERSGYLFFDDMGGADGLCTALRLCGVMQHTGKTLHQLADCLERDPQVSVSVRISPLWKEIWKNDYHITDLIARYERQLGNEGRILVRERSREAVIQILLEGRDFRRINQYALDIAEKIKERAGVQSA